jgi:TP901 family phage tail tape measure protein
MSEKLASAYVEITARTEQYMSGMASLKSQVMNDLKVVSAAVGASMMTAAAAAGAMGIQSVAAFGSFQKGMNEVFSLLPGITADAMGKMTEDVKSLATEMAVLPEQVIPALYQALSSGVPAGNVFEFLRIAQQAAVGGVTTLTESVKGLSSVVNAYGADVIDAARVSDIMFTTVRLGMTTFGELSSSLFNVAPAAAALGVKFEEVSAAMAAITLAGTPTSVAATSLRAALSELGKAGGVAYESFKKVSGKSFPDFIKGGGTFQQALVMMKEAADKAGTRFADMFGSIEAVGAVSILAGKGARTFADDLAAMNASAGATSAAYAQMAQGIEHLKAQWQAAKQVLLIEFGGALSEIAGPILGAFTEGLSACAGWFRSLSSEGKNTVAVLATMGTAFLAVTGTVLTLVGAATLLGITWGTVFVATGLAAIVVALGAAVAGVTMLISWLSNLDGVQTALAANASAFSTAWENVKLALVAAWDAIVAAAELAMWGIANLFGVTTDGMQTGIAETTASGIELFAGFALEASRWIRTIAENAPTVWELLTTTLTLAVVKMKDELTSLVTFVKDAMLMVGEVVRAAWDAIWKDQSVADAVGEAFNRGIERIANEDVQSPQQKALIAKRDALIQSLKDAKGALEEDAAKAIPAKSDQPAPAAGPGEAPGDAAKTRPWREHYAARDARADYRSRDTNKQGPQQAASAMSGFVGFNELAKQAQAKMTEVAAAQSQRERQIVVAEKQAELAEKGLSELGQIREKLVIGLA